MSLIGKRIIVVGAVLGVACYIGLIMVGNNSRKQDKAQNTEATTRVQEMTIEPVVVYPEPVETAPKVEAQSKVDNNDKEPQSAETPVETPQPPVRQPRTSTNLPVTE